MCSEAGEKARDSHNKNEIVLGDSVRYHAGSGGTAGGLGRDSGWG